MFKEFFLNIVDNIEFCHNIKRKVKRVVEIYHFRSSLDNPDDASHDERLD